MSARSSQRFGIKTLLLWATPVLVIACGGNGGTDIVLPALIVSTTTTGAEVDPDGYEIVVDESAPTPIGRDESVTVDRLSDGQHTVTLAGLAANCNAGDNPRTVTISSTATSTAAFAVTCHATTGSITATTSTTGPGSDPDGFSLSVDGNDRGTIAPNGALEIPGLVAGPHLVALSGLAANCQVVGDNPLAESVSPGETVQASFAVSCASIAPNAGTLTISTSTSGASPDPDGYGISVDGSTAQPVAVTGQLSVSNVAAGQHSVQLTGVASNCTVTENNPVRVSVPAGGTVQVAFTISCPTPAAGTGSVQVTAATSGSSLDDSYTLSIDGGSPQALGANSHIVASGLTAGSHTLQLGGVASNCTISGSNPQSVTITAGQTALATFSITCVTPSPTSGTIQVTASTTGSSLDLDGYQVSVDAGNAQNLPINGTRTFQGLTAGNHAVRLTGIAENCTVSGDNPMSVAVVSAQTASITFTLTCSAAQSGLNLHIANAYLTQSTQNLPGSVPLVAGRRAFLRVFAIEDGTANVRPTVRARFFRNGAVIRTLTISDPAGSTPATVDQGTLGSSWNVLVDASLIQPDVSMLLDVDPTNSIVETNEADNSYPASGNAQPLSVQPVPLARIRFVPIRQSGGTMGNVTVANKDQLMETARKLYPLNQIQTDVRLAYNTPTELASDGTGWNQVLSDIEALRVSDPDGEGWTYFGIARLNYQFGIVGLGFVGLPSAMGTDAPADVKRVVAHELGHTWNQLHTPCNNPPGIDPAYPYGTGIGVYGFDLTTNTVKPPSTSDIMGYCPDPWISDYIYSRVMTYRSGNSSASEIVSANKQPGLLVWGRIENGRPILEPAFQLVTRPVLPARPGAYTVQGIANDGSSLFNLSFDAVEVADDPRAGRHFAFVVPLDSANAARLSDLRLSGPAGSASAAASLSVARLNGSTAPDSIVARREAGGVALTWNQSQRPMLMVRDPDTGQVISFARGGVARVTTTKGSLDVVESDGVHSRSRRINVSR